MQEEYFWSIVIDYNSIQANIWNIKVLPQSGNAANVISISNSVAYEDDETLVAAGDECLSSCVQKLPENVSEPSKTVFGVPSSWVLDGQIKKEYLNKIRLLCNKLSLVPSGFVVLAEAIAHFEKSQEKVPMSGVLIGVYMQNIDIALFRLGNLVGSVNVSRSTNIVDDVVEGLARFESMEPVPSRFLLYDSKTDDLEDNKQSLIKADWAVYSNVKFLHTPQVEIFDNEKKMVAVTLAGAHEMGQIANINFEGLNGKSEEIVESGGAKMPDRKFGSEELVDPASLGFTTDFDFVQKEERKNTSVATEGGREGGRFGLGKSLKLGISRFRVREIFRSNLSFIVVIAVFFALVLGFCGFWFLPKADVTIYVAPQKITDKKAVKFDPSASGIDSGKLIVPAKSVMTTVTASKTKAATGTKLIGTSSKGGVTFYNVGGSTMIAAGTILTASNLQFSLDSDVQIASASGAASAATTKANITSLAVGADNNLAAGTYFTVGNFSSSLLQAKNDADLSGGSSQEVTAIANADISSLISDLTSQLASEGKDNLKTNVTSGDYLIDSTIIATASSKVFDHQEGEAASTVKLSMTSKVSALSVSRKDMEDLAQNIFGGQVKSGYVMSGNQIDFQFETKDVNFIINLLPDINKNKIVNEIVGKSTAYAQAVFAKDIPGYSDSLFKIKPNISFLKFLPHVPANITVKLVAK